MVEVNSDVIHFGVKGMRWGVRKSSTTNVAKRSDSYSEDYKRSRELINRGPKSLSDSQLRGLNKRLQMEQSYSQMMRGKSAIGKAKKVVGSLIATTGAITTLYNFTNSPAGKAMISKISKKVGT